MNFEEWWKLPMPAECDEFRAHFEACWHEAQKAEREACAQKQEGLEASARFWNDRANEQADTIAELNAKLEGRLHAEADALVALVMSHEGHIEAMQLRVARLGDALYRIAVHGDDTAPETMRRTAKQALSAEDDQPIKKEMK